MMKGFSNIHEIQSYNGLISDVQMWIGHYWYSRFSCFILFAVTGWGSQWCLPAIVDVRTALSRARWFKMSAIHGTLARNEWNASRICFFWNNQSENIENRENNAALMWYIKDVDVDREFCELSGEAEVPYYLGMSCTGLLHLCTKSTDKVPSLTALLPCTLVALFGITAQSLNWAGNMRVA